MNLMSYGVGRPDQILPRLINLFFFRRSAFISGVMKGGSRVVGCDFKRVEIIKHSRKYSMTPVKCKLGITTFKYSKRIDSRSTVHVHCAASSISQIDIWYEGKTGTPLFSFSPLSALSLSIFSK